MSVLGPDGLDLAEALTGPPSVQLIQQSASADAFEPPHVPPRHVVRDHPDAPLLRMWRVSGRVILDYDGRLFWLSPDRGQIRYEEAKHDVPHTFSLARIVERVLLPLYVLFEQPHTIGLHGSSVRVQERAHIFIGRSGAGKSTTAYELVRRGAKLIADDMTIVDVEQGVALGATPSLRLWKEAGEIPEAVDDHPVWQFTDKRWFRLGPDFSYAEPALIGSVIFLDPQDPGSRCEPRLEKPTQRDALVGLLEQTFDFSNPWREWMIRRFRNASRLVKEYPVYRFVYAKSESGEPTHVEPLLEAIRQIGQDSSSDQSSS